MLRRVFPGLFQKELEVSVSSHRVKNMLTNGKSAFWRKRDFQGSESRPHWA